MAPVTLTFPTAAQLKEVEQDLLPRLQANRPIFDVMPIEEADEDLIMWEQMDNFIGLQQVRGLNGQPNRVINVGGKRWMMQPGYYGEFIPINEDELTRRRIYGEFGKPVDISDLVTPRQNQLLQRRLDRIEYIGWTLLTTGTFSVANAFGGVTHTDTFNLQTFTSGVPWATVATATPLADMRAIKLLHRGHSVDFGGRAKLYLNQTTVNNMLNNQNANDLGGKRLNYGESVLDLQSANKIFLMNDLPQIVPMDDGYYDDTNTFQLFIANAKGCLVGKRKSGTPVATYAMTRNANNPDMGPGAYTKVTDNASAPNPVPRQVGVHDGHNGGPKIPFPGSIVQCQF